MIQAYIEYTGTFIGRPRTEIITFDESEIAMEKKNETTGRYEKITIDRLYNIYRMNQEYLVDVHDPEDAITPAFFEEWFYQKHLKDKHYRDKINKLTFKKLND